MLKERTKLLRTGKDSRPDRIKKKPIWRTTWYKGKHRDMKNNEKLRENKEGKIRGCENKKKTITYR